MLQAYQSVQIEDEKIRERDKEEKKRSLFKMALEKQINDARMAKSLKRKEGKNKYLLFLMI